MSTSRLYIVTLLILTYMQSTFNPHEKCWMKHKLESRTARRIINNLRYADDTTLMAECEEEQESLLMKGKEESEKVDLKCNIQNTKIMASGPITSWQIDGDSNRLHFWGLPNHCRW